MKSVTNLLSNHKFAIFTILLVVLISFFAYYQTAPRTNIGYGDSDEVITIAHLLGVAHPSGYPLVVIVSKLFSLIPLAASIAFRSNLLAMVTHAFTVGLVALCAYTLAQHMRSSESHRSVALLPIIASLLLTFSAIFWLYGGIIEVGALNNLFAGLLFLSVIKWQLSITPDSRLGSLKWWLIAWLSVGLGLSTVHTFILLVPGVMVATCAVFFHSKFYFWKTQVFPKLILPGTAVLFLFWLLPNLLLFWLNSRQVTMSWVFDQSFDGWWRLIFRRDYSGAILDKEMVVSAYIDFKSPGFYLNGAVAYIKFMFEQITWPAIALTVIGLTASWRTLPKQILITAFSFWLVSGFLFGVYMGVPEDSPESLDYRLGIGISHRQYQLGHISFGLLTVISVVGLIRFLSSNNSSKLKSNSSYILLSLVIVGSIVYQVQANYLTANQSDNTFLKDYARSMLDTAEPESVIICFSDISCYSLLYEQLVEDYRPDVTVLLKNNHYRQYFLIQNPQYQGYPYSYNPFFASDIISWNASQRTTYLSEPDGYYSQYMGFDANPFYLIPRGYLYQVTTQVPDTLADNQQEYWVSETLSQSSPPAKNYFQSGLKDYFAYKHLSLGFLYGKLGYLTEARYHLELAIQLNSQFSQPRQLLAGVEDLPGELYAPGSISPTAEEILKQSQTELAASEASLDTELLNQSYKTLLKAVFRDPQSPGIRFELAKLYYEGGYLNESRQELEYILKYNPDFTPAQEMLNQTSSIDY